MQGTVTLMNVIKMYPTIESDTKLNCHNAFTAIAVFQANTTAQVGKLFRKSIYTFFSKEKDQYIVCNLHKYFYTSLPSAGRDNRLQTVQTIQWSIGPVFL